MTEEYLVSETAKQALEVLKKQTFQNKSGKSLQLGSAIKVWTRIDIASIEIYAAMQLCTLQVNIRPSTCLLTEHEGGCFIASVQYIRKSKYTENQLQNRENKIPVMNSDESSSCCFTCVINKP